ncbi:hypothetical protein [Aquimarina amphilecti]|uniref:hypothetical protein n=1 Tax=Aquimarina amphilecti TaxID=1038014 RepID=UPI003CC7A1C2
MIQIKENSENPSQKFSNFFNAYTKAFNKKYDRVGSLFQRPFRRIRIDNEDYLKSLIVYIHLNPESHNISEDFKKYSYSSYQTMFSSKVTNVERIEVVKLFNDIENFKFVHNQKKFINDERFNELALE